MNVNQMVVRKFRTYMLRNLIMILILCLIMIPVCSRFYNHTRRSVIDSQQEALDTSLQMLNAQLVMVETQLEKCMKTNAAVQFARRETLQPSDYVALKDLSDNIFSLFSYNDLLQDMFVVFKKSGVVLTRQGTFTDIGNRSGLDIFKSYYFFSDEEFADFICTNQIPYNTLYMRPGMEVVSSTQKKAEEISFIYGGSFGSLASDINVYMLVDREGLESLFTKVNGGVELYDMNGNALCTLFMEPGSVLDSSSALLLKTSGQTRIGAMMEINPDYYNVIVQSTFITLLLFSLAMVIMGIVFSAVSAYSACRPLYGVLDRVKEFNAGQKDYDEAFNYLLSGIDSIQASRENVLLELKEARNHLQQNYIERCLHTSGTQPGDLSVLPDIENFPPHYMLAYVIVNVPGEQQEEEEMHLLATMIGKRLAAELNAVLHQIHYFSFVLIIPAMSEQDSYLDRLDDQVKIVTGAFGLPLSVALSSVYDSIGKLNAAYGSARSVMAAHDCAPGVHRPTAETVEFRQTAPIGPQLYDAVLAANYPLSHEILSELMIDGYPYVDLEQRYYYARMPLVLAQHELELDEKCTPPIYSGYLSPRKLLAQLDEYMRILCDVAAERQSGQSSVAEQETIQQYTSRVIQYINENYIRDGLTVQDICSACEINERMLNEICRTSIGMNAYAYIRQLRMDKAASLLRNTDIKVVDILKECGFNTPNAFFKAFKQIYGKSPSEYRGMFRPEK